MEEYMYAWRAGHKDRYSKEKEKEREIIIFKFYMFLMI